MPTKSAEFLLSAVVWGDLTAELDQIQEEHNKIHRNEHNYSLHMQHAGSF